MSETRRLQVLRAIVEDFVQTREPVGSRALVERHNLEVSPATIRNDMAQLEAEGLIAAPHTSAGRIPTDQGYRLFVDRISDVRPLSRAERRAMDVLLENADDHDAMLEQTVRLLAMLTNQVAVLQHPQQSQARIRHLEVLQMAAHRALVVVILSSGKVEQRMITLPEPVDEDALHTVGMRLLVSLANRSASAVPLPVEDLLETVSPDMRPAAALVVHSV